jgi:iron complex transport system permease protein
MTARDEATTVRSFPPGIVLAAAAVLWMAGLLWSARTTITRGGDPAMEVTATAYALPGALSASLVAGAAVALAVLAAVGRGGRTLGATLRFAVTTGAGLVLGLLGAAPILTINTEGWVYAVVAGAIAAAATIGGALGGFRVPGVVAAVCWAAIVVFAVGFVLNLGQAPLLGLLGSGSGPASQAGAARWFALAQAVLSGVAAGVVAFAVLRRTHLRWPLYALAGAGPGLLLLLAEALTRTAGARVVALAGRVSELELTVQRVLGGSRLNSALVVLFAGAITAIVALGRTLGPPAEEPDQAS